VPKHHLPPPPNRPHSKHLLNRLLPPPIHPPSPAPLPKPHPNPPRSRNPNARIPSRSTPPRAPNPANQPQHSADTGLETQNGWPRKAYSISKACVNALTAVLARENEGLVINACCPGWVATDSEFCHSIREKIPQYQIPIAIPCLHSHLPRDTH